MTCTHSIDEREACNLPTCVYCAVCGVGTHKDFAGRVANWIAEDEIIHQGLAVEGPKLVDALTKSRSLRSLAILSDISPTYLSQVRTGNVVISPGAYLRLSKVKS